mgnify:CR=1 FL=1
MSIRVLLADDQALVRAGFRALLDAAGYRERLPELLPRRRETDDETEERFDYQHDFRCRNKR